MLQDDASYQCIKCAAGFDSKFRIKDHMMRHHFAIVSMSLPSTCNCNKSLVNKFSFFLSIFTA